jgi:hypothetical protein
VAWFDRSAQNKLFPAKFVDVTPGQRRQPSWLAKARRSSASTPPLSVPPPPAIPNELIVPAPSIQEVDSSGKSSEAKRDFELDVLARLPHEPSRPSMTPAELEALVAERATKQATERLIEQNQAAILEAVEILASAHERLSGKLCERAVELAIVVARRVLARELLTQPDIVTDLVREGLEVLNVHDRVRVHLGPEFAVLKDALATHFAATGTMIDVNLDTTLSPYGCVVETEVGSVDESIESRLSTLLESLLNQEG